MKKGFIVFAAAATGVAAAAYVLSKRIVRGSGNVISQSRSVDPFKRVCLRGGMGDAVVAQADPASVVVEADDNLVEQVKTEVKDGTLFIDFDSKGQIVKPSKPIMLNVSAPDIVGLKVTGKGKMQIKAIKTDQLEVDIHGVGRIAGGPVTAQSLKVNIPGIGQCELSGDVAAQDVNLSGIGQYRAAEMTSQTARINISGVGNVLIKAKETLEASISGLGNVTYAGEPAVTRKITGKGKVSPVVPAVDHGSVPGIEPALQS